jgi:hypothetical protein
MTEARAAMCARGLGARRNSESLHTCHN